MAGKGVGAQLSTLITEKYSPVNFKQAGGIAASCARALSGISEGRRKASWRQRSDENSHKMIRG